MRLVAAPVEEQAAGAIEPATRPAVGVLVATKLAPPAPRGDTLPRTEVITALGGSPGARLTLLSAPAGWGKTTALAAWAGADPRAFAWLSLDAGDDDPVRFWTYLTSAVRTQVAGFGGDVLAALATSERDPREVALPLLLNALIVLDQPLVIALDDYHTISRAEIHDGIDLLLERLPATVHLALATRWDPPLRIARRRARGELAEIRTEVLRFRVHETRAVLTAALGRILSAVDVERLQERTEGWPAGLQLVTVSLQRAADPSDFVTDFEGGDRHIVDYLREEVLAPLDPARRRFLLETSILEPLCPAACDAVTGRSGSLEVLGDLEHANLFLVALDAKRNCYRYHALVADVLRAELRRTAADRVAELHRRASAWYRDQGDVEAAVEHAIHGDDPKAAVDLVAAHWNRLVNEGHLEVVTAWLDRLPEAVRREDARLCLAGGWVARDAGRLDAVEGWLAAADAAPAQGPLCDGSASVAAGTGVVRTLHRLTIGDVGGAVIAGRRALALEPPGPTPGRLAAACFLGLALCWRGAHDEAVALLGEVVDHAQAAGQHLRGALADAGLATIALAAGDPDVAARHARRGLAAVDQHGLGEYPPSASVHIALARVLVVTDREASSSRGREGLRLARLGRDRLQTVLATAVLAQAGEPDRRSLLAEGRQALVECRDPATVADVLTRALHPPTPPACTAASGAAVGEPLTDREHDVLRLLGSDLTQREIAGLLSVSLNTVKAHTRAIYRKLGVSSRRAAVATTTGSAPIEPSARKSRSQG